MIVLGSILAVLVLICLLPVGLQAKYDAEGPEVRLVVGSVSFVVYPRPKEEAAEELPKDKTKKKEKKNKEEKSREQKKTELGGKIEFFKELLGLGLQALGCIKRKLILKDLKLYLTVGAQGEDAAKGAITYGRAWAAVGALIPVLENTFHIKKRDIQVCIDYFSEKTVIYAEGYIVFLIGDILWIAVYYGIRGLKLFLKEKRKGRNINGTSHQ